MILIVRIQEHEGSLDKQIVFFFQQSKSEAELALILLYLLRVWKSSAPLNHFPLTLQSRRSRGLLDVEQMRSSMWRWGVVSKQRETPTSHFKDVANAAKTFALTYFTSSSVSWTHTVEYVCVCLMARSNTRPTWLCMFFTGHNTHMSGRVKPEQQESVS